MIADRLSMWSTTTAQNNDSGGHDARVDGEKTRTCHQQRIQTTCVRLSLELAAHAVRWYACLEVISYFLWGDQGGG